MNDILTAPPAVLPRTAFSVIERFTDGHPFELHLQHNGAHKAWTLPKGPVLEPGERHLAIETGSPDPSAGAGGSPGAHEWDTGACEVRTWNEERVVFVLHGRRLRGCHGFIRYRAAGPRHWIFISMRRQPRPETHANPRRNAP